MAAMWIECVQQIKALRFMKWIKWISILAAIALIAACFFPWVIIESKNIIVSGVNVSGLKYGHYGYFLIPLAIIFILLQLINRIWAKRLNVAIGALIFTISFACMFIFRCEYGECPVKQIALYILLASAIIVLVGSLLPDMKL
jgi:hypothetical protein